MYFARLELLREWIIKAFNIIKPDLNLKLFNRCSIFNNIIGAEDEYLFIVQTFRDGEDET